MTDPLPLPAHEDDRLRVLESYKVLDTPPEDAFDAITRLAVRIVGAPIALISLIDGHRQWIKSRYGFEFVQGPREASFCTHAILRDEVMVVPDALRDPRFAESPLVRGDAKIRFYAGAPLRTPAGHNIGTLCILDRSPGTLTAGQLASLEDLARLVVEMLELRHLSGIDPLTGAHNRRQFGDLAGRELRRAQRHGSPVSVLAIDVDHLRAINDAHGRDTGDRVLRELVRYLGVTLREQDLVARVGGEEFAVLLPETDATEAAELAARIATGIGGLVVARPGAEIRFGVTMGVAAARPDDDGVEPVIRRAEDDLYEARLNARARQN
jgi:diguanylate cyclase (GGDEF)-like protein